MKRQPLLRNGQTEPRPLVVAASFEYPGGATIAKHRHDAHQFVYAAHGVMKVTTAHGTWVVPPNRALWVPAAVEHEIRTVGAVQMRTLYVPAKATGAFPQGDDCAVVAVPALLRELILRLIEVQSQGADEDRSHRIVALILDEMQLLETQPLRIPLPKDARLRRICETILCDPGSTRTAAEWGADFGLSSKTLERDFVAHLGMTFGQWRQQVRLLVALERLASGEPITALALDLGYKSPSSFTVMFRKALGTTPSKYFA